MSDTNRIDCGIPGGAASGGLTLGSWNRLHGAVLLGTLVPLLLARSVLPIVAAGFLSFAVLIAASRTAWRTGKPPGGWANRVTFLRLAVLLLTGFFHSSLSGLQTAPLLLFLVLLDGLDGRLARKLNQQSAFGACFDRETDALYVCLTGSILYLEGMAPAWLLVPAFMRYGFVVLAALLRLDGLPDRRTRYGPAAALCLFLSLAAAFILPRSLRLPLLSFASILVTGSFIWSFLLLLRVRRQEGVIRGKEARG